LQNPYFSIAALTLKLKQV